MSRTRINRRRCRRDSSRSQRGVAHAANPNATLTSTANVAVAGIMLGTGYVLTGRLGLSIGLHTTWNLFQANVFGFPVSGLEPVGATLLAVEQGGPEAWTGSDFGPEGGRPRHNVRGAWPDQRWRQKALPRRIECARRVSERSGAGAAYGV